MLRLLWLHPPGLHQIMCVRGGSEVGFLKVTYGCPRRKQQCLIIPFSIAQCIVETHGISLDREEILSILQKNIYTKIRVLKQIEYLLVYF